MTDVIVDKVFRYTQEDFEQLPDQLKMNLWGLAKILERHTESEIRNMRSHLPHAGPMESLMMAVSIAQDAVTAICKKRNVTLACKKGCSYCCHLKVEAEDFEVKGIVTFVMDSWSKSRLLELYKDLQKRVPLFSHLSPDQYVAEKVPCAFLGDNGACQIYQCRPLICVSFHSLNVDQCKSSFGKPKNGGATQCVEILLGIPAGVAYGALKVEDPERLNSTSFEHGGEFAEVLLPLLRKALQEKGYLK